MKVEFEVELIEEKIRSSKFSQNEKHIIVLSIFWSYKVNGKWRVTINRDISPEYALIFFRTIAMHIK